MEFTDIIILILVASIVFELITYKSTIKNLSSFLGLGKLTLLVNDVNFNKQERDALLQTVFKSVGASRNSFLFSCLVSVIVIYFTNDLYINILLLALFIVSLLKYYFINKYATRIYNFYMNDIELLYK